MLQGGKVIDRVNGAHVPELSKKTAAHSQTLAIPTSLSEEPQPTPPKEVTYTSDASHFLSDNYSRSPTGFGNSFEEADKIIFLYDLHEGHTPGAKMWSVDFIKSSVLGAFWHLQSGASPEARNFSPAFPCTCVHTGCR
jgi:hypothetical protein